MQRIDGQIAFYPSDLNDYVECPHLTTLSFDRYAVASVGAGSTSRRRMVPGKAEASGVTRRGPARIGQGTTAALNYITFHTRRISSDGATSTRVRSTFSEASCSSRS